MSSTTSGALVMAPRMASNSPIRPWVTRIVTQATPAMPSASNAPVCRINSTPCPYSCSARSRSPVT